MNKKNIAALACWVVALGALFLIFRAGHPFQAHLGHADALYLPVLFDDLFRQGGRFADWFLTPAPYFFPDMPLYWLAWLTGDGVLGQTIGFALLQTVFATLALYLLARQVLPRVALPAAAALAVLLIWLGLTADDPFVRLFTSAHHYGAFLVTLLVCALWLRQDAAPAARHDKAALVAIVVLGFLTTLSDTLFLLQTAAPLLASALLFRQGALAATARRASLLLLLPALAGMLSYRFVVAHQTRLPARLGLSRLSENLDGFNHIIAVLLDGRPLLATSLLLSLGCGVACLVAGLRRRPSPALPRSLQTLAAFATLSFLASVTAMLLATGLTPVPRYLITALSLPLVAGFFVLVHLLDGRSHQAGPALCLALCLLFSGLLAGEAWRVREQRDTDRYFYPKMVACIDRVLAATGARHGIAQYWDAKLLQVLSRQNLTLAQYSGDLNRMEWITSERFYRSNYDFAIIAELEPPQFKLQRERLVAYSGEPARTAACGDRTVLLYRPGGLRTTAPLSAPVPQAPPPRFAAPGASFQWKGCELPSAIGTPTTTCGVRKRDPALGGFLTYGPYEPLPAGDYLVDIRYSGTQANSKAPGKWDVAVQGPDGPTVVQNGILKEIGAAQGHISARFTIEAGQSMRPVEIRTFAQAGTLLQIDAIALERLR